MSYATRTEVEALNPQRGTYSSATIPTAAQVDGYLASIAGEIDGVLAAQNLATPATTPASFLTLLGHLNALGAAALAETAAFPQGQGDLGGGGGSAATYRRMYEDGLRRLADGTSIPPEAYGARTARPRARSHESEYPDDNTGPVFTMTRVY